MQSSTTSDKPARPPSTALGADVEPAKGSSEDGDVSVKPSRSGRFAGAGLRTANQVTTAPSSGGPRRTRRAKAVPDELLNDTNLNADIAVLPSNYGFEVHKTVWRIRRACAKRVALQLPDGLLRFGCILADIIRKHCNGASTVVLGDVTYGACCVDDLSAAALGCDFLIHYGHSCLVPVTTCAIPMLYVFVHVAFDSSHLLRCVESNFGRDTRLALVGTIQFVDTVHAVRAELEERGYTDIQVPQARPLSPGELLGCTAPKLQGRDVLLYVGDGRFHLESAMIANPLLTAYRYDPYSKTLSIERYAHDAMRKMRRDAICRATNARSFGIILGTLGRQGSPAILLRLRATVGRRGLSSVVILLSEITPAKIETLERSGIQAWIQIACPRLSIDWGTNYGKLPLLTPYEAFVALGETQWREQYPMDFYAKGSGPWTNYYKSDKWSEVPKTDPLPNSCVKTECSCAK